MTTQATTLFGQAFPIARPTRTLLALLGGAALLTLSARIQVPMWPVPMTLQTLAVLLLAMTLGRNLATGAVATYLLQGALGLPVFSAGGGIAHLAGPTAGYLFGFVAAAWIVGWAAERGLTRYVGTSLLSGVLGIATIYLCGWAWLAVLIGPQAAFATGVLPFIAGDIVKIALAGLMLPVAWQILAKLR